MGFMMQRMQLYRITWSSCASEGTVKRGGWCQRVLYSNIRFRKEVVLDDDLVSSLERGVGRYIDEDFLRGIRKSKRRDCGPACDVWFGFNRRLSKEEMLDELEKLRTEI